VYRAVATSLGEPLWSAVGPSNRRGMVPPCGGGSRLRRPGRPQRPDLHHQWTSLPPKAGRDLRCRSARTPVRRNRLTGGPLLKAVRRSCRGWARSWRAAITDG